MPHTKIQNLPFKLPNNYTSTRILARASLENGTISHELKKVTGKVKDNKDSVLIVYRDRE